MFITTWGFFRKAPMEKLTVPFLKWVNLNLYHRQMCFPVLTYRRHERLLSCGWPGQFYLIFFFLFFSAIYDNSGWVQPLISSVGWIPWESRRHRAEDQSAQGHLLFTNHPGDGRCGGGCGEALVPLACNHASLQQQRLTLRFRVLRHRFVFVLGETGRSCCFIYSEGWLQLFISSH